MMRMYNNERSSRVLFMITSSSFIRRYIIFLILTLALGFAGYFIVCLGYVHIPLFRGSFCRGVQFDSCIFNGVISEATQSAIAVYIQHLCVESTACSLQDLAKSVACQFPIITSISLSKTMGGNGTIEVGCSRPLALVNQTTVLTADHLYVPRIYFSDASCSTLPHIRYDPALSLEPCLTKKLVLFLANLPQFLTKSEISITSSSPSQVLITQSSSSSLRCNYIVNLEVFLPTALDALVDQIIKDLYEQKVLSRKASSKILQVDLRFAKKIIVTVLPSPETKHGT